MSSRATIAIALALLASGCMSRTMAVRSDPAGAAVWVNHRFVGKTPVEDLEFTHYGTYEITLRKSGYRALTAEEVVGAPWYERFPADIVSDNLVPWRVEDRRVFSYKLEPVRLRPVDEVLADAREALARLAPESAPAAAPSPAAAPTGRTEP